jgi:hypothetical protein
VRAKNAALIVVLGLFGAGAVVATAQMSPSGLPKYTAGYEQWPKLNTKLIKGGSPAHPGLKNVHASKKQSAKSRKFPNGTVIVKSIAQPGQKGLPALVAVMRKVAGSWQWGEYELAGTKYSRLSIPSSVCTDCHAGAKAKDYVFTAK